MIKDEKLFMPVALVREWGQSPQVGAEFNAWKDTFLQKHALIDPDAEKGGKEGEDGAEGKKRGVDGTTPSHKRPKVQQCALPEEHFCLAADISEPLVHEIKLQKDWPVLQVRGSDTCYLVNNTQKAWSMNDCGVCFYGAGSYKILKAGQDLPERSVELVLTSHADTIVVNGTVTTLGQAVTEMRQKKPDCRIAYFEMQPGESLSKFQLRATHRVVFCGKEETATLARHNCAWSLPKSHLTPIWHMRWAAKGLLPVKPALHILGGMELEVGKAVRLTQSQS